MVYWLHSLYFILCCSILFCMLWSSSSPLHDSHTILFYTTGHYIILYCPILCCSLPQFCSSVVCGSVVFHTIQHCYTSHFGNPQYQTTLHCTISCYSMPLRTILYYSTDVQCHDERGSCAPRKLCILVHLLCTNLAVDIINYICAYLDGTRWVSVSFVSTVHTVCSKSQFSVCSVCVQRSDACFD